SVVSYQITQLEQELACILIYRSTRKLSLTDDGKTLYHYAQQMLSAAEQGVNSLNKEKPQPIGKLSLSLPSALTKSPITCKLAEFSKRYPQITLNIQYTDVRQNIIAQGIDLAIRAGEMNNSTLKMKKIGEIKRLLVCSVGYFAKQQVVKRPEELSKWQWVKLSMLPNYRSLINYGNSNTKDKDKDKNKEEINIHFNHQITVDNVEAMTQFCLQGCGLATPPDYLVNNAIKDKILVQVFPNWQVPAVPLYATWPNNHQENNNTRLLIDHLLADKS
ncbi:MAG: DNA-binding transcriptional LysR family regulator, partial [Alteromonadaceae bacterium]